MYFCFRWSIKPFFLECHGQKGKKIENKNICELHIPRFIKTHLSFKMELLTQVTIKYSSIVKSVSLLKSGKTSCWPNCLHKVHSSLRPTTVIHSFAEWVDWYYSSLEGGGRGRRYPSHNTSQLCLWHLSSSQHCHYRITIPTVNPATHPPPSSHRLLSPLVERLSWGLLQISVQELTLKTDSFSDSCFTCTMWWF